MKHPKLYIKNEKGRYEEYQIPDMDVSETLFRRINGKYVPIAVNCTNFLPEGVWVVTRGRGTSTLDVDVELPEGYVADITLRVHTSFYNDRGDYFTPPESSGTHSWEVTHLDIWDAEGELAEEMNDLGYMGGEYEW